MPPMPQPEVFDPNAGDLVTDTARFPTLDTAYTAEAYADVFTKVMPFIHNDWATGITERVLKDRGGTAGAVQKAITLPPEMVSFARLTTIPEDRAGNLLHPPGIAYDALRKIVRENLAPQMIINLRVSDLQRYSELSTHVWKPGWEITMRQGKAEPGSDDLIAIKEAERFILNCNSEYEWDARRRDKAKLTGFSRFLAELGRDSLTYDGMSVWTDMDHKGRVKGFKALSTFNIRLAGPGGYKKDENIFACGVDEMGNVVKTFTREELIFYTRNPRADPDVGGYGYPEIEMGIRLIQGFQNAFDMNVDTFSRNAIPNGFLTVSGRWTQRQLDVLSRIWLNLKRGVTKAWSIPVIALPEKGEIKVNDLTELKGKEVYYQEFINMLMGAFCAVYGFPVSRLGYRVSGAGKDTSPKDTSQTSEALVDEYDPGLMPLLHAIENLLNDYIIRTRWPQLQFQFNGKNPREDARSYEAKTNAMTLDEHRAMSDLPPMESLGKGDEEKSMLRLMGMSPYNSAMAGIWQSIIAAKANEEAAQAKQQTPTPGAPHPPKKDPAAAQEHGHISGVRRNSAAEKASTDA
jgi:hypothetical protein